MQRILLVALLSLFINIAAKADNFIVHSFEPAPNDLAARRYERTDFNDQACALIKLRTSLQGLQFDATFSIIGDVEINKGEYWIYVSPDEKRLTIMKTGFTTLHYNIPVNLKSNQVYHMHMEGDQKFPISINRSPAEAKLIFDGEDYGSATVIPDVMPGTYSIFISHQGYEAISDTIQIAKDNLNFSYDLKQAEPQMIRIYSNPQDATILLNDEEKGRTNKALVLFPGTYTIKLTKYQYKTVFDTIAIKQGIQDKFEYDLIKNTSFLTIDVTPVGSKIFVDEQPIQAGKREEVMAGRHQVRIENEPFYREQKFIINTELGEHIEKSYNLERKKGNLYANVQPEDAKVELKQGEKTVYSWTGANTQLDVPTGQYQVNAFATKHESYMDTIHLMDKENKALDITLYPIVKERGSKIKAIIWSMFIPGAGQWYSSNQNFRGTLYFLGSLAGIAGTYYFNEEVKKYNTEYLQARESYSNSENLFYINQARDEMEVAYDQMQEVAYNREQALMVLGGAYGLSLLDALIFGKRKYVDRPEGPDFLGKFNMEFSGTPHKLFTLSYTFDK